MISSIAFVILLIFTLASNQRRSRMLSKSFDGWVLDLLNLPIQGIVVPILQTVIFYELLSTYLPNFKGQLEIAPIYAFAINFFIVDYLYYWNHRLLHVNGLRQGCRAWDE